MRRVARKRPSGALGIAVGLAGAAAVLVLAGPGVEAAQAVQGTLTGRVTLTPSQAAMRDLIREAFDDAALGFAWRAAVVNAYAESALDPNAEGDGGKSIGLFQLHEDHAGSGMSRIRRRNPGHNTDRIIEEAVAKGIRSFRTVADGSLGSTTNGALAAWFAANVENCAKCGGPASGGRDDDAKRRVVLVDRLFGAGTANTIARI